MEKLKTEFSKYLTYLGETVRILNIERPFNTRVEFNQNGYNCGIIVEYDDIRRYNNFDENVKSYIQTRKETNTMFNRDMIKIVNIQTIQVNQKYRGKGHFKYMINEIENLCKTNGLILKISEINNKELLKMLVKNGYYIVCSVEGRTDIFNKNNFPENFNKCYDDIKAYKFFINSESEDNTKSTFSMTNKRKSRVRKTKRSNRKMSVKKSKRSKSIKKPKRSRRNL
jgi:hypothetical protein